ncbi:LCP family protein [Quadrisphaera sp. DSM 44207]|uniref:LCP family protein n=1 Tax=Quadrisphaera sp. DSM 44207 TaxID=1881057 RepID=UPI001C409DCA|nr:LCP family protein [Quadrisphaera sp. DSM 44207]
MRDEPQWGPATTYTSSPKLRRASSRSAPPARRPAADPRGTAAGSSGTAGPPQEARTQAARGRVPGGTRAPQRTAAPPRHPATPSRGVSPARRRGQVRLVVLLLLLAVVGYPLALGLVGLTSVDDSVELADSALEDTPGRTVLLVGSDSREDLTAEQRAELSTGEDVEGRRTDTIMLLHRPTGGGPTVLLSLPRDSYVAIPGHDDNKINAAYSLGGPALLAQTVEGATGLRVDGYAETGLGGFAALVDAVGGVEMCPEQAITDPKAGLDIAAGCQEMDGATALGYARTRDFDPRGDLGRAERQRQLMAAIAARAASPATLLDPFRAFPMVGAAGGALTTDDATGPVDLARFALGMRAVASGDAVSLTVPVARADRRTSAGLVVDWDEESAAAVFDAIRDDETEPLRAVAAQQLPG